MSQLCADHLLAQVHDAAGRVDERRADGGAFEGAVAAPDAVLVIHQAQQPGLTGQAQVLCGGQGRRAEVVGRRGGYRAGADAQAALQAVAQAQVVFGTGLPGGSRRLDLGLVDRLERARVQASDRLGMGAFLIASIPFRMRFNNTCCT